MFAGYIYSLGENITCKIGLSILLASNLCADLYVAIRFDPDINIFRSFSFSLIFFKAMINMHLYDLCNVKSFHHLKTVAWFISITSISNQKKKIQRWN